MCRLESFFDNTSKEKRENIIAIATIVLAVAAIWTAYESHNLIAKQLETFSPVAPSIKHSINDGKPLIFSVYDLAPYHTPSSKEIEKVEQQVSFTIKVRNIGQSAAGYIRSIIDNKDFDTWYNHSIYSISNLNGTSGSGTNNAYIVYSMWYNGCSPGRQSSLCNALLVPIGHQNFNLTLECEWCEQKKIVVDVPFCVYRNSTDC